jgi:hypothetical protein
MLPLHYAKYGAVAFNPITTPHEEKSFTKTDELPSSLWDIQRATLVTKNSKGTLNLVLFTDTSKAVNYTGWLAYEVTQDDAYILYSEQLDEEFKKVIDLVTLCLWLF